jgi:RNA polymerase sigma-70 factor (ECF subfamily)
VPICKGNMSNTVATRFDLPLHKEDTACSLGSAIEATSLGARADEILINLISTGNKDALGVLFRRYARVVRGVALRVLKDPSEADDLLQDIFILIHRLCGTFDSSKGSAQSWILQMAYRRAISRRRYLNSRHFYTQVELDEQSFELAEPRCGHSDDPVDSILAELDLQKLLGALSEDQQKTLRLHFIEGYTLDEIAKILGQTKGNVRHHSFRGLERLRKLIFASKLPGTSAV